MQTNRTYKTRFPVGLGATEPISVVSPAIDPYHFVFELALGLGYARAVAAFWLRISSSGLSSTSDGSPLQTSFRVWSAAQESGKGLGGTTKTLFKGILINLRVAFRQQG